MSNQIYFVCNGVLVKVPKGITSVRWNAEGESHPEEDPRLGLEPVGVFTNVLVRIWKIPILLNKYSHIYILYLYFIKIPILLIEYLNFKGDPSALIVDLIFT